MSQRTLIIGMVVLVGLVLVACALAGVTLAGIAQDALSPRSAQTQGADADADAHATVRVDSRCTGLLVTGCNVTVQQDLRQDQKPAPAGEPAQSNEETPSWYAGAVAVTLTTIFLLVWALCRRSGPSLDDLMNA